jgi:hypothetical protein
MSLSYGSEADILPLASRRILQEPRLVCFLEEKKSEVSPRDRGHVALHLRL